MLKVSLEQIHQIQVDLGGKIEHRDTLQFFSFVQTPNRGVERVLQGFVGYGWPGGHPPAVCIANRLAYRRPVWMWGRGEDMKLEAGIIEKAGVARSKTSLSEVTSPATAIASETQKSVRM